jgi:hypothetical protein
MYLLIAFVCEFQHTPLWRIIFSQRSTSLVGMRLCRHVPNSTRNKNMKSLNPYLLQNMFFLDSKTQLYPSDTREKTFISFECYDLAISKE